MSLLGRFAAPQITIQGDADDDRIVFNPQFVTGAVEILGGQGNDQINAASSPISVTICGGDGADTITGSRSGGDLLLGGSGDDIIFGGGGAGDRLEGEAGDDILNGSRDGADTILVVRDATASLASRATMF